jgi:hypothetical protein
MEHIWGEKKCIQDFVQKQEENIPLGRDGHRLENYIKISLRKVSCGNMDCSQDGN